MSRSRPRIRDRAWYQQRAALDGVPLRERLFASRGVVAEHERRYPLVQLQKPEAMADLQAAASVLANAIQAGDRILIVGDYDVDGATSTALAILALRSMGAVEPDFFMPDRFTMGYGLSPAVVAAIADRKPDLLLTVDNGIAANAGVAAANAAGMQVLITDHHLPGDQLPDAVAIVNPNRRDCPFPAKSTAGVGVVFYVLAAVRKTLDERGWFTDRGMPAPKMVQWMDLVALGTVADLVPLEYNNRVLVTQGLQRIRAGHCRPAIWRLLEVGGRDPAHASASDLGFAVAPRLNAAGRLDDISLGIRCLLSEDESEVNQLVEGLEQLNQERRRIQSEMRADAVLLAEQAVSSRRDCPDAFILFDASWHEGVSGIVASQVRERFHRPALVFAPGGDGLLKGSGRSVPGFHLRDALHAVNVRHPDLIERFGGHAMAAGLTLPPEALDLFREAFLQVVGEHLSDSLRESILETDGKLSAEELCLQTALDIAEWGPWGQGFEEPLFRGRFRILDQRILKERHLKWRLQDVNSGVPVDAIAFDGLRDGAPRPGEQVELAYRPQANRFRGVTRLQLLVEAWQPGNGESGSGARKRSSMLTDIC